MNYGRGRWLRSGGSCAPTFIILDSHIGYGSPHKQDTAAAHGDPLGEEEIRLTKRDYGWPEDAKFLVPDAVRDRFGSGIGTRGPQARGLRLELPPGWDAGLPIFPDASRVILDQAAHAPYEDRGSIKAWQESVARPAIEHALAVLAISIALAAPLLHLAGLEGGGVHVFGPSSQGKTTILRLAASVWGGPSFVRSWRATANGLEGAVAGSSDTLLVLDELSQVETRDAASSIYQLANGTGKASAGRDGALREPKTWRVLSFEWRACG